MKTTSTKIEELGNRTARASRKTTAKTIRKPRRDWIDDHTYAQAQGDDHTDDDRAAWQAEQDAKAKATPPPVTPPAAQTHTDTRLPIDAALRAENRKLDTQTVCGKLRQILPDVASKAQLVGSWVWVQFTERPEATTRQALSQLGFHWNTTRQAWQHPCGKFSLGSKSDPRDTYTSKPAMEALN